MLTVNDYLARRDAELLQDVYRFCGVRVAWVQEDTPTPERRLAYQADVTHCTNKEVVGDFLRDRLAIAGEASLTNVLLAKLAAGVDCTDQMVLRGLPCAIVDEADSILIDEAVTPLIISGDAPNHEQVTVYQQANALALQLRPTRDFHVDERYGDVRLTNDGRARVAELAGELGGLWAGVRRREELVSQSLHAHFLMRRGDRYVVDDDKVVIVDGSTGRLMPDRTWRDGLHQAVEAKEGLEINPAKETLARISFQRFFRLYRRLSGMTGTAREAADELWLRYECPIAVIPPNRPCQRRALPDRVFVTAEAKWRAVVDEVRRIHTTGQPLLIGTRSVQDSEHLSSLMDQAGVSHRVLNAVRHAEEVAVVEKAGQHGAVTVATNMAGRGTDIKLGQGVEELGGLHVLATEKHESPRVDRQLYGRAGRQGDPGSAQAFQSLEDELVIKHASRLASICRRTCATTTGETHNSMARRVFTMAQRSAERRAHSQRDAVQSTDDWLDDFLGFAQEEY